MDNFRHTGLAPRLVDLLPSGAILSPAGTDIEYAHRRKPTRHGTISSRAARRFFEKATRHNNVLDKVTTDKSGANKAALEQLNKECRVPIEIRQVKYINHIVEQDHRAIKRITRPMLGFKSFRAARAILAGIELMLMIRKGQFVLKADGMSFADQFYALAGQLHLA